MDPRPVLPPDESQLPPRHAYVPGGAPHPTADPAGHSFGLPEPEASGLDPARWRDNEAYLFGVDLFNRGYYWEAHEAWESVWHACNRTTAPGLFVQGLIQIAAALLRWHMGTERGAQKLYAEGRDKLEWVRGEVGCDWMGIDLDGWLAELEAQFAALLTWPDATPALPVIRLAVRGHLPTAAGKARHP